MAIQSIMVFSLAVVHLVSAAFVRGHLALSAHHPQLDPHNETAIASLSGDQLDGLHFRSKPPKIKVKKAGTVRVEGHGAPGVTADKILVVNCFEPFAGPDAGARCPAACPYMRFDPERMCHFKCITKDWCLNAPNMPTSFPDDKTGTCVPCQVPGCAKCISPTQCSSGACQQGFDMVNGMCLPQSRIMWRWILGTIAVCVIIFACYLFRLWSRPVRQEILLKLAMKYRNLTKLRRDEQPHPLYPKSTNLCRPPIISGVGVLLHFRFQAFWLVWSFVVLVAAGCLSLMLGRFKAEDALAMSPTHEEVFRECREFGTTTATHVIEIQEAFTYFTGILYVGTTIACIMFAVHQRRTYFKEESNASTMEDYALCVYNMPVQTAYNGIEEDYKKFFADKFQKTGVVSEVIGVSICWDYSAKEEHVVQQSALHVHSIDKHYDEVFLTKEEQDRLQIQQQDAKEGVAAKASPRERACNLDCLPELRCLDSIFVGNTDDFEEGELLSPHPNRDKIKELVENLTTSGIVFLVVNSEKDQQAVLHEAKRLVGEGNPISYPSEDKSLPVTFERDDWDPATLLYTGFSVDIPQRNKNIMKGICITLLVIVVWAVFFYGPYIVYVMSWSKVSGNSQGDDNTMMLLGLMCCLGNQVVYFTCAKVSESVGFRSKDYSMTFNCCLYTTAVFINIIVDVSLMLVLAHGYQQDSGMNPSATIRNPSFQYSLYIQLVTYLYPMTLLAPYVAEPLPMNIIPYFLCKWMVRSAFKITRFDAEQALECPEFDLLRYGDILVNVSTVLICLFLASSSLWWIFLWLFVSNVVIYLWDHFRFLRCCTRTFYANDLMEVCSQYISALPCALLAAAYVFKRYEGEELIKSWDVDHNEDVYKNVQDQFKAEVQDVSHSLWAAVIAVFFAHVVIHIFVLTVLVPKLVPKLEEDEPLDYPYKNCAEHTACNWFNSNPVHCLRSKYLYDVEPPLVYYMRGKEYTHKRNPEIHAWYEEEQVADTDTSVQEELKETLVSGTRRLSESVANKFRRHHKSALGSAKVDDDEGGEGCSIL